MADYKKMYCVLCKSIDSVIEPLEKIPFAEPYAKLLEEAMLKAENIYIETSADFETTENGHK